MSGLSSFFPSKFLSSSTNSSSNSNANPSPHSHPRGNANANTPSAPTSAQDRDGRMPGYPVHPSSYTSHPSSSSYPAYQTYSSQSQDPLTHLRHTLETLPQSKKHNYIFTPAARAEVLSELYQAFLGGYGELFLPSPSSSTSTAQSRNGKNAATAAGGLAPGELLSQVQARTGFCGAGTKEGDGYILREDRVRNGRKEGKSTTCAHILKKGEACFRCKDCALDDSCVLCARCFHATHATHPLSLTASSSALANPNYPDRRNHNVSFFIAQQSGGCCDCGDEEAWRPESGLGGTHSGAGVGCPYHGSSDSTDERQERDTMDSDAMDDSEYLSSIDRDESSSSYSSTRTESTLIPARSSAMASSNQSAVPVSNLDQLPHALQAQMSRTIAYALDFVLSTMDHSPLSPGGLGGPSGPSGSGGGLNPVGGGGHTHGHTHAQGERNDRAGNERTAGTDRGERDRDRGNERSSFFGSWGRRQAQSTAAAAGSSSSTAGSSSSGATPSLTASSVSPMTVTDGAGGWSDSSIWGTAGLPPPHSSASGSGPSTSTSTGWGSNATSNTASGSSSRPALPSADSWDADPYVHPSSSSNIRSTNPEHNHNVDGSSAASYDTALPPNPHSLRLQPSADPLMKDVYCVVLWNDDKHSFDEVGKLLMDLPALAGVSPLGGATITSTLGAAEDSGGSGGVVQPQGGIRAYTHQEATALTSRIDEIGRAVILTSSTPNSSSSNAPPPTEIPDLLTTAHRIAQLDLGVTIRRGYDTFREEMVGVIVEWLLDLTRSRIRVRRDEGGGSTNANPTWEYGDNVVLREILAEQLLAPRGRDGTYSGNVNAYTAHQSASASASGKAIAPMNPARIDALFLAHTKLWKKPRLSLKEIYTSVLTLGRGWKEGIASHFALTYPRILDHYLLVDREAETSIKYFALQLFTVPSVAAHIVLKHGLMERLLVIIQAFFANRIKDRRIITAGIGAGGSGLSGIILDPDSFPFKSKRFMPIFSDLRYLVSSPPIQRMIAGVGSGATNLNVHNANESVNTQGSRNPGSHGTSYVSSSPPPRPSAPSPFTASSRSALSHLSRSNSNSSSNHNTSSSLLLPFIRTCQLFMSVNPNKRMTGGHVEYEGDAWISVFNVTLSLGRVVKVFGGAFGVGEAQGSGSSVVHSGNAGEIAVEQVQATVQLVRAIEIVVHHILLTITSAHSHSHSSSNTEKQNPALGPLVFHEVLFGNTPANSSVYRIVKFDVLEGWVSFHHSLHWLLAELFKHVGVLGEARLASALGSVRGGTGGVSVRDVVLRSANESAVLGVVDFPLRVLAMIAQIRTGLWVRNGFAIRGQLLHYRDFVLRELCYDQDLFILQIALVLIDPNTVIVSILDRFGLLSYFSPGREALGYGSASGGATFGHTSAFGSSPGAFLHPVYDSTQLSGMVEEVLYVLITILSESANISGMSIAHQARRELIHSLALGPSTYTDLVKRVSERLVDDVSFEGTLKDVAAFKPPESTSDIGMYELKDECFEEVNPFFYHYTRNKREEVEGILRARIKKRTGAEDPVLVPKPLGVTHGPFTIVSSTFESEVLLQVMFYAVYNVLLLTDNTGSVPPSGEAILDQGLHLVMLAIVERPQIFCVLASIKLFEEGKTMIDVLCRLEWHDSFKSYKSRAGWILNEMANPGRVPEEVNARRYVPPISSADAPNPEEARKKAAKARQEAIMRQMKAQQASFAFNFDAEDMDEDGEDEDMDADNTGHMHEEEEEVVSYGTCIVCQEDLNSTKSFGTLGMVQPSRFIRRQPDGHTTYLNDVLQASTSLDRALPPSATTTASTFPPPDAEVLDAKAQASGTPHYDAFPNQYTRFGLHSSVCSHMMHLDCFHVYSLSIRQRHRAQATRNHPETIPRKEYICPLCKSLGNVILPVTKAPTVQLNSVPFPDWTRSAGINILKSKPDPALEALQFRNGTGEFVFWSAQDTGYSLAMRSADKFEGNDGMKMVDTVMVVSKSLSQQTRHLRERHEPEPGERGAGIYLPEELIGYTISSIEVALRGIDAPGGGLLVDNLSESQMRMIRGLLNVLTKLAALHFKSRPDEGREAVRQAIIKRLLPEWSRSSLTSFSFPLLLRDPFSVLVETAAVAPKIIRHVVILTYYACLARTVIGLVFVLNKIRSYNTTQIPRRQHENIFGDVRMFFMSVVRHSPVFEHTATLAFETFGEARIEKLLYEFTIPFLRKAAILCRSVLPSAFPTPDFGSTNDSCEYARLLMFLGVPPLSDLPNQDTLQNALSGWCAHHGHSHSSAPLNFPVVLDIPCVYRLARLPLVLDNLFVDQDKAVVCTRCSTIPVDAAICLLCGTTVCFQSTCCTDVDERHGECNMHTRECGGALGIYFLVKRCIVIYLYGNNGTFAPSPYLDVHGEPDISMRRGRRQYLHHARWEDIRKTWMNHGVPTMIARKLEGSLDSGGWETY